MPAFKLYLESGPKRRKTMVHVLELLGCTANGATTESAIEATPEVIRAYRRFQVRAGEPVNAGEPFDVEVAEHITEGVWIGNGTPYIIFQPELEPVSADESEVFLNRFHHLRLELVAWAQSQTDEQLDAKPAEGRSARAILKHITAVPGMYISGVAGGAPGWSRLHDLVDRDQISLSDGLLQADEMLGVMVRGLAAEQRAAVIEKSNRIDTLRKGFRRVLEHDWEHLLELSHRPDGPAL